MLRCTRKINAAVALPVFLWFAGAVELGAQQTICHFSYKEFPGTEITVQNIFDRIPTGGHLPARVTITNSDTEAKTWNLEFTSFDGEHRERLSLSSGFDLHCEAQSEITHEILVPLATVLDENTYSHRIRIVISAPGLGSRGDAYNSEFSQNWPSIGISEELATRNLRKLDAKLKNSTASRRRHANGYFGFTFQASQLPGDWRGFAFLDALMITGKEWLKLSPGSRQAALQWNRMGGELHIYSAAGNATLEDLGIDGAAAPTSSEQPTVLERKQRSLGIVQLNLWNGKELDVDKTYAAFEDSTPRKASNFISDYSSNWNLLKEFGTKSFNRWLILTVLLVFGILVGPVNLWVFARPGKRHLLFVTTPLISIGASLFMALMIFLSDGVGGKGLRFTVLNLEPDPSERKAYLYQEQISRTGLLLGRGFAFGDEVTMRPVNLSHSQWSLFDQKSKRMNRLRIRGNRYDGDWFRSRSEIAHALETVRTSRARIEKIAASKEASPRLFSSLGFDIDQLYYIDENGAVWKSRAAVTTGSEIALTKSEKSELDQWWKASSSAGSSALKSRLAELTTQKDLFFATTADPSVNPLESGTFIRWKSLPVLVFGHLMEVESPLPPQS